MSLGVDFVDAIVAGGGTVGAWARGVATSFGIGGAATGLDAAATSGITGVAIAVTLATGMATGVGAANVAASRVPSLRQNLAFARFCVPQLGQTRTYSLLTVAMRPV